MDPICDREIFYVSVFANGDESHGHHERSFFAGLFCPGTICPSLPVSSIISGTTNFLMRRSRHFDIAANGAIIHAWKSCGRDPHVRMFPILFGGKKFGRLHKSHTRQSFGQPGICYFKIGRLFIGTQRIFTVKPKLRSGYHKSFAARDRHYRADSPRRYQSAFSDRIPVFRFIVFIVSAHCVSPPPSERWFLSYPIRMSRQRFSSKWEPSILYISMRRV